MGLQKIIMEKFSVNQFLQNVKKESVTHVYVAPLIALYLAKNPSMTHEHLSSLVSKTVQFNFESLYLIILQARRLEWHERLDDVCIKL